MKIKQHECEQPIGQKPNYEISKKDLGEIKREIQNTKIYGVAK